MWQAFGEKSVIKKYVDFRKIKQMFKNNY